MTAEGLSLVNIILIDGAVLIGFYWLIHRVLLAPQKEWRAGVYDRLNRIEQRTSSQEETIAYLKEVVKELKTLSEKVVRIETKLEGV